MYLAFQYPTSCCGRFIDDLERDLDSPASLFPCNAVVDEDADDDVDLDWSTDGGGWRCSRSPCIGAVLL